ncbi:TPA: helix-turn-helix domain-containing protein [Serratia fonticola]|nr:helix-turn-helix domain-containing protein [Serratia fonticola]
MGTPRFTHESKEEAVRQLTERRYTVADVSERLGVSQHSLYKWIRSIKLMSAGTRRRICWLPGRSSSG